MNADGLEIYQADALEALPELAAGVDLVLTDPPYGDTALSWDSQVSGWWRLLAEVPQLWTFGSFRFLMALAPEMIAGGWVFAQDVIWEKHNGSGFLADRFRRVHEQAVHLYRGKWCELYNEPPKTMDATKRSVTRGAQTQHAGRVGPSAYATEAGGARLMRSVMFARSLHGEAIHPTQKPVEIMAHLIECSCPPAGLVLDPFMGSGTTLAAARLTGRRAIGIEINPKYCAAAVDRLRQRQLISGGQQ